MKFLLVVYTIFNGQMSERPLAIFADQEDCNITGYALADFATRNNTYGAELKYNCKPFE